MNTPSPHIHQLLLKMAQDKFFWFFLVLLACIFAWDHHGRLGYLGYFFPDWSGLGNAHSGATRIGWLGLYWDQELISFLAGGLFMVAIPAFCVKWLLRRKLSEFGLSGPAKGKGRTTLIQLALLAAITFPGFFLAASFTSVREYYPYYHGDPTSLDFLTYELSSSLFYLSIEGMFRGFMLFGILHCLISLRVGDSAVSELKLCCIAIVLSVFPYAIWHLDKPPAEIWGTIFWGIAAGASAISTRTIWHLVVLHWLLNVFMDYLILLDS